ncbi:hypothetical protein LZD49_03195 [Dyadobacter sp. CY261]|uniref:hypothetical protein n=1 Tax=Dyadobacter sp. CY261 TaxID=2907203 RepID=UPI001F414234|nr:hypothetical protein [Dyadobacter sp. CY261]MCF0069460.1 hypothetical protein [Dyadobacter sp. CY261]
MNEQEIVKACLTEIFRRNGYEHPDRLTQRDFEHISQEIERVTGILVSSSTIKRLLAGQFSRLPQIATLDAISRYLEFKNWQGYKAAFVSVSENETNGDLTRKATALQPSPTGQYRKWILLGCAATLVIAVVAFVQLSRRPGKFEKATFTVKKTTANDIPNTVVFNYNIDDVTADSFFIQQSWDKSRRVQVFKNTYTLTDIYYEPGYHIAKLIANDSVIRAIDVSIPTDRWFFFAKDQPTSKPEYIRPKAGKSQDNIQLTVQDLTASHIDITKEKEYAYNFFPSKTEVNSDDFTLKTTVSMKEVRSNSCPYISLEIFTQRYPLFLKLTSRGCVNEASMQLGERFISGQTADLGFLGCDVLKNTELEVRVRKREVTIYINSQLAYSGSYQTGSRLITGLGFMSNGLIKFDQIELRGADGTIVYDGGIHSKAPSPVSL